MESNKRTRSFYSAFLAVIVSVGSFYSCAPDERSAAEKIIEKSIEVSGGEKYSRAEIEFYFRNRKYTSKRKEGLFNLERVVTDSMGNSIRDILSNEGLERLENDRPVSVPDSLITRFSDGVNSVFCPGALCAKNRCRQKGTGGRR